MSATAAAIAWRIPQLSQPGGRWVSTPRRQTKKGRRAGRSSPSAQRLAGRAIRFAGRGIAHYPSESSPAGLTCWCMLPAQLHGGKVLSASADLAVLQVRDYDREH